MKKYSLILGAILFLTLFSSSIVHSVEFKKSRQTSSSITTQTVQPIFVIPTIVVADYWFFLDHGIQSVDYIHTLMNLTNSYYFNSKINVSFAIEAINVDTSMQASTANFTYNTYAGAEIVSGDLLTSLNSYHINYYPTDYNVILLSGQDFDGGTIGLGYVNSISGVLKYSSIVQATSLVYSDAFIASTIAHELGHTLSAVHDQDTTTCSTTPGIMSASSSPSSPETLFSACSKADISDFLAVEYSSYLDSSFPVITQLDNLVLNQQANGVYSLIWSVSDAFLYSYWISSSFSNTTHIPLSFEINNTSVSFAIPLDNLSSSDIVLTVKDGAGRISTSQLHVSIVPPFSFAVTPSDTTLNQYENLNLTWQLSLNTSVTYWLYLNSSLMANQVLTTDSIGLQTNATQSGSFNYTIVIMDSYNQSITDTVLVAVNQVNLITGTTSSTNSSSSDSSTTSSTPPSSTAESTSSPFNLNSLPFSSLYIILSSLLLIPIIKRKHPYYS